VDVPFRSGSIRFGLACVSEVLNYPAEGVEKVVGWGGWGGTYLIDVSEPMNLAMAAASSSASAATRRFPDRSREVASALRSRASHLRDSKALLGIALAIARLPSSPILLPLISIEFRERLSRMAGASALAPSGPSSLPKRSI